MATVFDQLTDLFIQRKKALSERDQAARKLPGYDYFMPKSAKKDLEKRQATMEEYGVPGMLQQAAQETYQNPAVNAAIGFTPVIGDLQSAYEAVKAAKEGQWAEAGLNALGVLPFVPALKTTWHGSPHGFTKFDLSKIGTGEGAQAYGHGAYLAEAKPVAEEYAKTLSNDVVEPAKRALKKAEGNPDAAIQLAQAEIDRLKGLNLTSSTGLDRAEKFMRNQQSIIDELQKYKKSGEFSQGYLYKVDLPDEHIAKMLDWDKPLSEQPQVVQEGLRNALVNRGISKSVADYIVSNKSGQEGLATLARGSYDARLNVPEGKQSAEASRMLYAAGIPGIQYLDQGSRGAGEGTRNYVVFDENIPTILERNGLSVFDIPKD